MIILCIQTVCHVFAVTRLSVTGISCHLPPSGTHCLIVHRQNTLQLWRAVLTVLFGILEQKQVQGGTPQRGLIVRVSRTIILEAVKCKSCIFCLFFSNLSRTRVDGT